MRDGAAFDDVWCVVDVDTHATLEKALAAAQKNEIKVAVSGPCFEVWLILHHADHGRSGDSQAAKRAWAAVPAHRSLDMLAGKLGVAMDRAKRLRTRHEKDRTPPLKRNPSTEMDLLIEAIAMSKAPRSLY